MNRLVQTALLACAAAPFMMPAAGFAQDQDCTCVAARAGAAAGTLLAADGDVLVSQPTGFVGAAPGSEFAVGSRIMVGPNSSAAILVGGTCRLDLAANADVNIQPTPEGGLCVRVTDPVTAGRTRPDGVGAAGPAGFGLPEIIFSGALLGVGIAVATEDDDRPSSP